MLPLLFIILVLSSYYNIYCIFSHFYNLLFLSLGLDYLEVTLMKIMTCRKSKSNK